MRSRSMAAAAAILKIAAFRDHLRFEALSWTNCVDLLPYLKWPFSVAFSELQTLNNHKWQGTAYEWFLLI